MIDEKEFEENFAILYEQKLIECGICIVRLHAEEDNKYRAIEFVTKPLDEKKALLGFLRSQTIADRYDLSISVENLGDEKETILGRSFLVKINKYNKDDNQKIMDIVEKLKVAEKEFYRRCSIA